MNFLLGFLVGLFVCKSRSGEYIKVDHCSPQQLLGGQQDQQSFNAQMLCQQQQYAIEVSKNDNHQ